jgi:acyl-CoA thioesterase FadM
VCTAAADAYRTEGRPPDSQPSIGYATGSLSISYLHPVPIAAAIEVRACITERTPRKTRVECTVFARGQLCARAEVLAIRLRAPLGDGFHSLTGRQQSSLQVSGS